MAVVLGAMFFAFKFLDPADRAQVRFASYKASVVVESPSLTFSKDGDREFFAVVGFVKNSSDFEWRSPYVEAKFFNAKNEMIDTMSSDLREVVLLPKASAAFRVTGHAARPSSEYARVEVRVTSARAKARWE